MCCRKTACIWNIIISTKSELSEYFLLCLWCVPLSPATLCWWIRMRKCLLSMAKKPPAQKSGITTLTENAPILLLNMSIRRNIKGTRTEILPERFQTRDARSSLRTEIIQVVQFYIYGNAWCLPMNQPWKKKRNTMEREIQRAFAQPNRNPSECRRKIE